MLPELVLVPREGHVASVAGHMDELQRRKMLPKERHQIDAPGLLPPPIHIRGRNRDAVPCHAVPELARHRHLLRFTQRQGVVPNVPVDPAVVELHELHGVLGTVPVRSDEDAGPLNESRDDARPGPAHRAHHDGRLHYSGRKNDRGSKNRRFSRVSRLEMVSTVSVFWSARMSSTTWP